MQDLTPYKDNYIHFVEAGFIAINQGDEDSSLKLFKAAALISPENTLPKIGFGYLHLCKLELKQACKYFNEVLEKEPQNEMASTFLGLSLCLSSSEVSEGEKKLETVVKTASDASIKNLAESTLNFVEKFIKKPLSDFQKKPSSAV